MTADEYRAATGLAPLTRKPGVVVAESAFDPERGDGWNGSEKALQAAVVAHCRARGLNVCETSQRRPSGQTIGMPDLFVQYGTVWHGIEVKTRSGTLSPAQRALAEAGGVTVVRSVAGMARLIERWE